jgi:hypothetical protein
VSPSERVDLSIKLATWNLAHGRTTAARRLQEDVLHEIAADVAVLTEPARSYVNGPGVVVSAPGPNGGLPWIAIIARTIELVDVQLPYERLGLVTKAGTGASAFIVYGTVLPWASVKSHAPTVARTHEDSLGVFRRVLDEQVNDIHELRRRFELPVVWIGDFNCSLVGSARAGSHERRRLLLDALGELELTAWNVEAGHAIEGLSTIDLICGPKEWRLRATGRIDPVRGSVTMSDHAGYWVEVEVGGWVAGQESSQRDARSPHP